MFVELHMIQNFAPSNLNRDDTGNPKDTEFGGYRRARISSQCIKRAIRRHPVFAETTGVDIGERTKWMTRPIKQLLIEAGKPEEDARAVAAAFARSYAGKMDGKSDEKTSVLLYLSRDEISLIVDSLLQNWDDALQQAQKGNTLKDLVNEIIKQTKGRTSAPDIALFGRMLADKPELNIDAAVQMAHAISTHRANMEMDYYTAVDDLQQLEQDEGAGAGMVGFTSFNSACFYRYARIDWNQLITNLNGDEELARRTVEGFLRAAVAAVPSGKQNAFAAQNPPSFLLAVIRDDGLGWSLANAFETPIRPTTNQGYVGPSIQALDNYWGRLARVYGSHGVVAVSLSLEDEAALPHLSETLQPNLDTWIARVIAGLPVKEPV